MVKYRESVASYVCCVVRFPLPLHYSLTMELAKDRMTAATVETCSEEKFDKNECARHTAVGQQFIRRSLNEPCYTMVCTCPDLLIVLLIGLTY